MGANKFKKLLMVSDFNENSYLGVFEVRNSLVMMKFAFRIFSTRPPFSKWLPTKSSNLQWSPISMKIDF
jgi:hypothetical protein